ncbi:hypothetical protein [Psychrobacter sp. I-STPA10]|uniref:hypothetical protein n=1 Tax=Psychrobacter sp. I-STPA10 TaxID=2585769 RepID=UPI001E2FA4FE|nr:hypothetical protein [Psychrobacter sp. I-STPA10]
MRKFAPLLIAAIFPLLLFRWFIPNPVGQIDFWILWFVAMVAVGLPVLFAEVGLAYRSQQSVFAGMQQLTREADVSPIWRGFAWLSAWLSLLIAALSIVSTSQDLLISTQQAGININMPTFALATGLVVIVTLLSLLAQRMLLAGLGCIIVSLLLAVIMGSGFLLPDFTMTQTSLSEWAQAVMLALISVGVGTGLYWFTNAEQQINTNNNNNKQQIQHIASKVVLPIWTTQLAVGVVAIIAGQVILPPLAMFIYAIGVVLVSAYLLYYASSQFAVKFGRWLGLLVAFIGLAVLVLTGSRTLLLTLLVITSIASVLVLAIFSGWQMKISHMRKSLNFSSEGRYNLWRVAIRLLVPLLVLMAVVGWFIH